MSLHQKLKQTYGNTTGYGHLGYFCCMLVILAVQSSSIISDLFKLFSLTSWNEFRYGLLPLFRAIPALLVAGVWLGHGMGTWKFLLTVCVGVLLLTVITPVSFWLVFLAAAGCVLVAGLVTKLITQIDNWFEGPVGSGLCAASVLIFAIGILVLSGYAINSVPRSALSFQYSKQYRLLNVDDEKSTDDARRLPSQTPYHSWLLTFPSGSVRISRNSISDPYITLQNTKSGLIERWTTADLMKSFRTCKQNTMTHAVDLIPGYLLTVLESGAYTATPGEDCETASRVMLTLAIERGAAMLAAHPNAIEPGLSRY